MEEKSKIKRLHKVCMENRKTMSMTGINDIVSFDPGKVILESDYGMITIKGSELHVNRLSVEKGELDIEGNVNSYEYSELKSFAKKGESLIGRLLK